jgi:3-deoxy-D-manno-octulosonic-acid transferase
VNPLLRPAYAAVGHLARAAVAIAPAGHHKLIRSLRGRRGLAGRYVAWGRANRAPDRPLVWLHAPSVGEGLQARPVIRIFQAEDPGTQLAYTHFSASAERFAGTLGVDFADYLPIDTVGEVRRAVDALRPSALIFAKLDVWPNLVEQAGRRGARVGMISATLVPDSGRTGVLGRALLRDAYARLEAVGAIDPADASRLVALGVRERVISITGDTRYDQVWEKAEALDRASSLLAPLANGRPTLVAGSTWPGDDRVLLPAVERVRASHPAFRLIVAPHEPTPDAVASLERWAERARVSHARVTTPDASAADLIIVDRVGLLGDLYALGDMAFVGGGFHGAGLHSVLEPAAFGMPVLFGPRIGGNRDAEKLIAHAASVSIETADALADRILQWCSQPGERAAAGARARAVVADGLGAARASYELIRSLLGSG